MNWIDKHLAIIFFIIPVTWAGSFIAGKYVVLDISPMESVFWRFLFSAVVMFPFLIAWHKARHPRLSDIKFVKHITIVVITSGIIYHLFFFWALKYTSPTNTALIIALNPFFTALGEIFVFKKMRSVRFYTGFVIALSGALWVILTRGTGITPPGIGELFCLIASLSWSVYTIAAKKTKQESWDPLWIAAYNYFFTAILVMPFISSLFITPILADISFTGWVGLWYMAIFPTAIGYTLYYIGVQKKGPAWAATYIYLVPSFTANLDYLFFKAQFTTAMVAGTTMVVLGLILGNISQSQINGVIEKISFGDRKSTGE